MGVVGNIEAPRPVAPDSVRGCDGGNATAPSPAIAPGGEGIDPFVAAVEIGRTGVDPRLPALVPGFDAPFFQAGLAGYSDAAMRLIARRHGCPMCVTEALLDRTLLAGGRGFAKADMGELHDNVPGGEDDHPLVGQIMGSDPGAMAAAALKMLEQRARTDREYRELAESPPDSSSDVLSSSLCRSVAPSLSFACIDINLACPVKKIERKARGGHWLREPDGAIAIMKAVRGAVPESVPVAVKLRRGSDDTPVAERNFFRIFDAAYDLGCAWTTVHGRTVEQKYIGPSRWDFLRDLVRRSPDRLVFGSGDVWDALEIFRMLAYTGVRAVSVARGCIGNPWVFRQARAMMAARDAEGARGAFRPPTLGEQRGVLLEHFRLSAAVNGEAPASRMMRKFGIRFAAHHPKGEEVRRRFIGVGSLEDWRAVLDEFYGGS